MAFCNSCGASLVPGTRFCNKCGSPITASTPAPAASPTATAPAATPAPPTTTAAAPTTGGSGALKIILIVVGIIVLIGVLGVASVSYFVYHVAKSAHVRDENGNVKVETPFGNVETSSDPEQAAKDLGVDIYPGAQVQKSGASTATIAGIHTVTANFESSDSVDKVCAFYKSKFPNAMVATSDQNRCTFISNDQKNMITVNVESSGNTTKLQITNVSKKAN